MEFILKVKYCCENHRLLHHPEDHEEPWPIIVKYKPGVSCCCCKVKEIICAERWAGWWWLPGTLTRERWSSARRLWWRDPTTRSQLLTAWNVSRLALRVDTWMQHISLLQELEEGVVCSDCGWPVCNAECSAGPNHQIECKVKNPDATIVKKYLVLLGADCKQGEDWPGGDEGAKRTLLANLSPQGSPQSKKQPRGKILAKKKQFCCVDSILNRFLFQKDYAVVQKMLGHRERHTQKETWHLYKWVQNQHIMPIYQN